MEQADTGVEVWIPLPLCAVAAYALESGCGHRRGRPGVAGGCCLHRVLRFGVEGGAPLL